MNKIKWLIFAGVTAGVAAVSIFAAQAQTTTLAVSCAGSVLDNQITWTATSTGGNAPYVFVWSGDQNVAGQTSTSFSKTYTVNGAYSAVIQVSDASSSVATSTCSATVTANVPLIATSAPQLPRVNQPMLSIGPRGAFIAHGMTVTSVASGSFQAQVWGITYTVNWSGNILPEFYFRNGNGGNATTSPSLQIAVGDEVGVSGHVASTSPLVVNANVVRDYSIAEPRPGLDRGLPSSPFHNGEGNRVTNGSNTIDFSVRMNSLLNQLHNLQNLFKGRGDVQGGH